MRSDGWRAIGSIPALVLALALGGCASEVAAGDTTCPPVPALPGLSEADAGLEITASSDRVLEPLGFGTLAEGACAYEIIAADYESATIIVANPTAAQAQAFVTRLKTIAADRGYSLDESSSSGNVKYQGQDVDAGISFNFDYLERVEGEAASSELVDQLGLEEGDAIIVGGVYLSR